MIKLILDILLTAATSWTECVLVSPAESQGIKSLKLDYVVLKDVSDHDDHTVR